MKPLDDAQRDVDRRAGRERGPQRRRRDPRARTAGWSFPGESITDPIAYTAAPRGGRGAHGAELRTGFRVAAISRRGDGSSSRRASASACAPRGRELRRPFADEVARLAGDDSFEVYPRKGEFLVFDPPGGEPLEQILLPVPTKRTKGVLVFPTLDGKVVAGPTAVDQDDKDDWSVRPEARERDPPEGGRDVPAARGRRADRRLRGPAAGGPRGQLPDRAVARLRAAGQRRGDQVHRPDRIAGHRRAASARSSRSWASTLGAGAARSRRAHAASPRARGGGGRASIGRGG